MIMMHLSLIVSVLQMPKFGWLIDLLWNQREKERKREREKERKRKKKVKPLVLIPRRVEAFQI